MHDTEGRKEAYEIKTLQYGEYKDVRKCENIKKLINELITIEALQTVQILEIKVVFPSQQTGEDVPFD